MGQWVAGSGRERGWGPTGRGTGRPGAWGFEAWHFRSAPTGTLETGSGGASWGGERGASTTRVLAASRFGECPSAWFGGGRPLLACPPWGRLGLFQKRDQCLSHRLFVGQDPRRLLERGGWPEGGKLKLQRVDAIKQCSAMLVQTRRGLAMLRRVDGSDKQQPYAVTYRKNVQLACSMLSEH